MASKNIVAKGTTYNGVESVTFPVSGGGDATFYEISDTTCTASDVLNSKYFYSSSGVKTQGTGTVPSPTLITKSITANGTYNASSDNADGYSSVTVSVSGGGLYPWLSSGAEKVGTLVNKAINLSTDTTYDSWTASTTAGTILNASATDEYTFTGDLSAYDFVFITQGLLEPKYVADTPMTSTTYRVAQIYVNYYYGTQNSTSTSVIESDSINNFATLTAGDNLAKQFYYNSSGTKSAQSTQSSGPCFMSSTPSYTSSLSGTTLSVGIRFPAFYAKCYSGRFATERKAQVDSANTNYLLTVDAYRIPRENGVFGHWVKQMCAYLNGG